MKKSEVQVGHTYTAKVSEQMVAVRITRANPFGGWNAENLKTGREVRIRSAQRLRREVPTVPMVTPCSDCGIVHTGTCPPEMR